MADALFRTFVVEPTHAKISTLLLRYTPLASLQKPENILFVNDHSFDIKLVDFGSAAIIDDDTVLRDFMATPFYAAPEVWERNYGQECDIWSIGAILYVLVEGLPPSLTRQTAHKNPTWVDLQVGSFVSFPFLCRWGLRFFLPFFCGGDFVNDGVVSVPSLACVDLQVRKVLLSVPFTGFGDLAPYSNPVLSPLFGWT
jgi:serine/threonine protein kinase